MVGALMAGMAGGASVNIIIRGVDAFSGTFAKANVGLSGLQKFSMGATGALGSLAAAGAIVTGVIGVKSVKAFQDAETAYAKVNTLLDEGVDAQETYGETVKNLNVAMGNQGDQLDVLEGLYQTVSAGITDSGEATEFMTAATRAAVGGSAELSQVILAGTKFMAAFGEDAGSASDVMDGFATAVKSGQLTMSDLASTLPNVSGLAAEMGLSTNETLGVVAGLTKVLGNADEATTAFSAGLRAFLKPSDAMKTIVKDLGFESASAMVKQEGFMGALQMVEEAVKNQSLTISKARGRYAELQETFAGISDEGARNEAVIATMAQEMDMSVESVEGLMSSSTDSVEIMGELFSNVRAMKAVFPALGTAADTVTESISAQNDKLGQNKKQYGDMADTAQFKVGAAMSSLKNDMISMGETIQDSATPLLQEMSTIFREEVWPAIQMAVESLASLLEYLGDSETFKTFLKNVAQVLKGVFTLVALLFKGVETIAAFNDVVKAWADVFKDALAGAFEKVINKLKDFWDWIMKIVDAIVELGKQVIDAPFGIGKLVFSAIKTLLGLEEGGIVTRPTAALIGEAGPEAVIPLDRLSGKGMGSMYNIKIENIYGLDPDEIAEALQLKLENMVTIA